MKLYVSCTHVLLISANLTILMLLTIISVLESNEMISEAYLSLLVYCVLFVCNVLTVQDKIVLSVAYNIMPFKY